MEDEYALHHEVQQMNLLDRINKLCETLGSTGRWKRIPECLERYAPLKDKRVVMVDDLGDMIEIFIPHLVVATAGKASFIQYTGQQVEDLVQQIILNNPNIVLMDYHLSESLKGTSVTRALVEQCFSGSIIGFSSDSNNIRAFREAGAIGGVEKCSFDPKKSVLELARVVSPK